MPPVDALFEDQNTITLPPNQAPPQDVQPNANGLIGIRGELVYEGRETGDERFIEAGALYWDEGPWVLMARIENDEHKGAPLIGRIDELSNVDGTIQFVGVIAAEYAGTVIDLVQKRMLQGISADMDSADIELQTPDGKPLTEDSSVDDWANARVVITKARIRGGTMLPMPAFAETQYELFELDNMVADAFVASAANTKELPPTSWFQNPDLQEATPLQISADGHIFGHIALWGQCHIGSQGNCVTPPRSSSDYAMFTRGSVLTWCEDCGREEEIAVGPITSGTGHASLSMSKAATIAHYDNSGYRVADVAAGEDSIGIWVSGRISPTAKPGQIDSLMAMGVSGDWRRQNGNLEMVAVLSVPVSGYPIPRKTMAHVASGVQVSLVTSPFGLNGKDADFAKRLKMLEDLAIKQMTDQVNAAV